MDTGLMFENIKNIELTVNSLIESDESDEDESDESLDSHYESEIREITLNCTLFSHPDSAKIDAPFLINLNQYRPAVQKGTITHFNPEGAESNFTIVSKTHFKRNSLLESKSHLRGIYDPEKMRINIVGYMFVSDKLFDDLWGGLAKNIGAIRLNVDFKPGSKFDEFDEEYPMVQSLTNDKKANGPPVVRQDISYEITGYEYSFPMEKFYKQKFVNRNS